jgi:acyl transferase domain-containing protein
MSQNSEIQDYSSLLRDALVEIEEMQFKIKALEQEKKEPLAIIGMGCRFPGKADNPETFWQILSHGVDAIQEVPTDRWNVNAYYDPNLESLDKMNTRWGGFLNGIDQFDPHFFGLSIGEASVMDPQQRLLLEVTWEALENAGIAPERIAGSKTSVFVGIASADYYKSLLNPPTRGGTGIANSIAANRLSYLFDLQGPSVTVDTACSSSLTAVHLGCQSLRTRESNLALVGGVNIILIPELAITLSQAGMMASDGRCKTFDAAGDGYVRSEGCGMIVLKRLSDAVQDGDRILALLRGSAVNQDGRSIGLSAPNGLAQQAVMRQALSEAGVKPSQISYVEAHGTGTPLGDPIEVHSFKDVLTQGRSSEQLCWIGSVKTNIGHLEAAAGIAGLIKVVMSLQHKQIPPNLHLKQLNPHIDLKNSSFAIPTQLQPWLTETTNQQRFAGVSSFGVGGTNVHVVLEEAPADLGLKTDYLESLIDGKPSISSQSEQPQNPKSLVERPLHILTLSAKKDKALRELANRYERYLAEGSTIHNKEFPSLPDICFTANTGRSHFDYCLAIVADSPETLQNQLIAFATAQETNSYLQSQVLRQNRPKIAFLFSGQGTQYIQMGRQVYATQPTFQKILEQCDELLRSYLQQPLLSVLYPESREFSPLNETSYAQPALFALEYALAQLWRSWGIEPDAVIGYDVGEYVAACVAGVFSLEDGLRLMTRRERIIKEQLGEAKVAAVLAEKSLATEAVSLHQNSVSIAAVNSSQSRVVLEHEQTVDSVQFTTPHLPLISPLTGKIIPFGKVSDANYWRHHTPEPMLFHRGMQTLAAQGYELFLEIGPTDDLIHRCKQGLPEATGIWLASLKKEQDNWVTLLDSLKTIYLNGIDVNWVGFDQDYPRHRVALPTYPFQRKRCWLEPQEMRYY